MSDYWDRFEKTRASRRNVLKTTGWMVAGSAGLALVGCGGDDDSSTGSTPASTAAAGGVTPAAGTPQRGGTLRVRGIINSNLDLDPHRTNAGASPGQIYNTLMRFSTKEPGRTEGGLAQDSPEVSPDGLSVVFKLRPEAKWQNKAPVNGRVVDAEDIKLSFQRIKDPSTVSPRAGLLANVKSIDVVDPQTVKFTLGSPQADIFSVVSDIFMDVLPKEISSRGLEAIKSVDDVIGSGPYEMTSFTAVEQYKLRRRADGYWRPNTAWLDGYDYNYQVDGQQLANGLRAGQADVVNLPIDLAKTFEGDASFTITQAPSAIEEVIAINHTRERYQDPRVRLAIQRAINRKQVYDGAFGGAGVPAGPMSPIGPFWALPEKELLKLPGFGDRNTEIKEAKALLNAAGFPDGFDETVLAITAYNLDKVHEVVVSNLRDVGIRVKTDNVGTDVAAQMLPRLVKKDYNLATFGFASGGPYPDGRLVMYHHSDPKKGSRNYFGFSSPELDAKLDKQSTMYNTDERLALVYDIQRDLIEHPGPAWIGVRQDFTVWSAKVQNAATFGFYASYYGAENNWLKS